MVFSFLKFHVTLIKVIYVVCFSKVISFEKSLREQRMRLDADVAPVPASYTYNLINEDFTDDLSPITLSTRGWDPTMPQPKKKRKKIPGLSVSALGALKTGKKKTPSKSSGAGSSGALARTNINEMLHVRSYRLISFVSKLCYSVCRFFSVVSHLYFFVLETLSLADIFLYFIKLNCERKLTIYLISGQA